MVIAWGLRRIGHCPRRDNRLYGSPKVTMAIIFRCIVIGMISAAVCITAAPWEYPINAYFWLGHALFWLLSLLTTSDEPSRLLERSALAGYYQT